MTISAGKGTKETHSGIHKRKYCKKRLDAHKNISIIGTRIQQYKAFRDPRAHLLGLLQDQELSFPKMSNQDLVKHIYGHTAKFGWVQKRIAQHASFVWVEFGKTFRDATFQEAAQMRKEQAKLQEPIPFAELPGLMFRKTNPTSVSGAEVSWTCSNRRCQNPVEFGETLCPTCQAPTRQGFTLVKQANQFCQAHA